MARANTTSGPSLMVFALGAGGGNHRRRGQIQPRALPSRPCLHGAGREAGIHHLGGRD
jgi:hypothetical protein